MIVFGKRKMLIAKVGKAEKTALVSSNRRASFRKDDTLTNLRSHLETIGQKSATVGLVILQGRPKYVKGRDPLGTPKGCGYLSLGHHVLMYMYWTLYTSTISLLWPHNRDDR